MPTKPTGRARSLRQQQTEPERRLWSRLRSGGLQGAKFRRQQPFGPYFLDFYCHEYRLAVEVDGAQHFEDVSEEYDKRRTIFSKPEACECYALRARR